MPQITTAGRLLADIGKDNPALRDAVAMAAGVLPERADAAAQGMARLTLSEQLRLSEAVAVIAPSFERPAVRLRSQVLAARSFETGDVEVHRELPVERWERSAAMRR